MPGDENKHAYEHAFKFNKKFRCGNSGHLCSYDIYAVTVLDMYMESSVNEGNKTPPRNSSVLNVVILECNGSYLL
jgi:hypothetical protein